ncbi:MAG: DUF11 domain-containing protein, partial [Planctomycetales bacterium]
MLAILGLITFAQAQRGFQPTAKKTPPVAKKTPPAAAAEVPPKKNRSKQAAAPFLRVRQEENQAASPVGSPPESNRRALPVLNDKNYAPSNREPRTEPNFPPRQGGASATPDDADSLGNSPRPGEKFAAPRDQRFVDSSRQEGPTERPYPLKAITPPARERNESGSVRDQAPNVSSYPAVPADYPAAAAARPATGQPAERQFPAGQFPNKQAATGQFPSRQPADGQPATGQFPSRQPAGTPRPLKVDPFDAPSRMAADSPQSKPYGAGQPAQSDAFHGSSEEGTGLPGNQKLDGLQTPRITVEKKAPAEMQVGQIATVEILVHNAGRVPAHHVTVMDEIPRGAKLVDTRPKARRDADGRLIWNLGTLNANDQAKIQVQLIPLTEGEVGSVADVTFRAQAGSRSQVTRPRLAVQVSAPRRVMKGEKVPLNISISNPGTGVAVGVVLRERIPLGLEHPAGEELEYEIGDLAPTQTR